MANSLFWSKPSEKAFLILDFPEAASVMCERKI